MRKIIFMSLASLITLTGCSGEENELLKAIDNSYDLNSGSIVSKFDYTTEYNNIDIAGTVDGTIKILFGDDYDKISANINFEDAKDSFEYYIDNKGKVVANTQNSDVAYAPLYIEAPDLGIYEDSVPEPTKATIKINDKDVNVNQYSFNFDKLNSEVAKSLFDPIIKLGFISPDILQADEITGNFKLNYYVEPESGNLVKESLEFSNKDDDKLDTKTSINIENVYTYDEQNVTLPEGYGEVASDTGSEETSEEV